MNAGVTIEGGARYGPTPNVIAAFIAGIQYDAAAPTKTFSEDPMSHGAPFSPCGRRWIGPKGRDR